MHNSPKWNLCWKKKKKNQDTTGLVSVSLRGKITFNCKYHKEIFFFLNRIWTLHSLYKIGTNNIYQTKYFQMLLVSLNKWKLFSHMSHFVHNCYIGVIINKSLTYIGAMHLTKNYQNIWKKSGTESKSLSSFHWVSSPFLRLFLERWLNYLFLTQTIPLN